MEQLPTATTSTTTIAQEANKFKISAKNINVGRLRDASEQTEKILVRNLQNPLVQYLRAEYEKCAALHRRNGRFADLIAFQHFLMDIPKWSAAQVETVAKEIISSGAAFKFYETIKFLLVAKVFLMASVRAQDGLDAGALSMPMPTMSDYIHRVLYLIARELFVAPSLIRIQADSYELEVATNHQLLNALVERGIRDAVMDLVPHDHIMDVYLSDTLKGDSYQINAEPEVQTVQTLNAPVVPVPVTEDPVAIAPVKLGDIVALNEKKEEDSKDAESDGESDDGDDDAVELSSESESETESESESDSSSSSSSESESESEKKKKKKSKKGKKEKEAVVVVEKKKKKHHKKSKEAVRQVKMPKDESV